MDCHFLLQGIFPTQGSNPHLPHCRQMLYRLSHQGSRSVNGIQISRLSHSSKGMFTVPTLGTRQCQVLALEPHHAVPGCRAPLEKSVDLPCSRPTLVLCAWMAHGQLTPPWKCPRQPRRGFRILLDTILPNTILPAALTRHHT